jgi:hypothetical protein
MRRVSRAIRDRLDCQHPDDIEPEPSGFLIMDRWVQGDRYLNGVSCDYSLRIYAAA